MKQPIANKDLVTGMRQRERADGSWRVWWEPTKAMRDKGFEAVELKPDRPTWSIREAERLNADVARVRAGKPKGKAGGRTMAALIASYRQSPKYLNRAPATRSSYDGCLRLIENRIGPDNVTLMDELTVEKELHDIARNNGLAQAHAIRRMLSILFGHAERIKWRPKLSNPCLKETFDLPKVRPRARRADWSEFDQLLEAADRIGETSMRCAIVLAALAGQRQADTGFAELDHFRKVTLDPVQLGLAPGEPVELWAWFIHRRKRGTEGVVPILDADLVQRLEAQMERARAAGSDLLFFDLVKPERDVPREALDPFTNAWRRVRKEAACKLPDLARLQWRDLRRTMASWSRQGGASRDDAGSVLGNSVATNWDLSETYMPPDLPSAFRAVSAIQRPTKGDNRE